MRGYIEILRRPGVAVVAVSVMLTRLPQGINGLALLLFVRDVTGSFTAAGVVAGSVSAGMAIGAPLLGRLVDRRGVAGLLPMAWIHAVGLTSILLIGELERSALPLVPLAFVTGLALPPASSVLRSRWPALLGTRHRDLALAAFAFDSVLVDIAFVTGPLIAGVAVAVGSPAGGVAVSAGCVLIGTSLFVRTLHGRSELSSSTWVRSRIARTTPLRVPEFRSLVLGAIPVGIYIGSVQVALPAFSTDMGEPALAGVLLAGWAGSSAIAGLAYGAYRFKGSLYTVHGRLTVLLPLSCVPLILLASSPMSAVLLASAAGMPIAPLIASRNQLIGVVAPAESLAEAFTWPITSMIVGIALGVGIGGSLAEHHGWVAPLLLGTVCSGASAALLVARKSVMVPETP